MRFPMKSSRGSEEPVWVELLIETPDGPKFQIDGKRYVPTLQGDNCDVVLRTIARKDLREDLDMDGAKATVEWFWDVLVKHYPNTEAPDRQHLSVVHFRLLAPSPGSDAAASAALHAETAGPSTPAAAASSAEAATASLSRKRARSRRCDPVSVFAVGGDAFERVDEMERGPASGCDPSNLDAAIRCLSTGKSFIASFGGGSVAARSVGRLTLPRWSESAIALNSATGGTNDAPELVEAPPVVAPSPVSGAGTDGYGEGSAFDDNISFDAVLNLNSQ